LIALALASIAACSPDSTPKKSESASNVTLTEAQRRHVRLYTVALAKFRKSIETTGIVDFDNDQSTVVLAPFGGPVSQVLVKLGQDVKKGEPLALVDSPDYAAAISTYRKAIVTAANARRLADLDKDLLAHEGVSAREEQQAQTDAASAEADRESARQALIALNVDPQIIRNVEVAGSVSHVASAIRAPIAGTLVEKPISPGQLLTAGTTPCFTIADLSRVWVLAQVFGPDLTAIAVGDPVRVTTGIGPGEFTGAVDNISSVVDPDTRSVAVRVVVDNPGDLLKKAMYVRVRIAARQDSAALLVPVSAVLRDDENLPFVYIAARDGSFARGRVTLGTQTADRYEITAGLQAGERVVGDGAIFLQFMQSQ
jgi:cobalt-zinc-cadmium efflux system membrane fusion protein